MRKHQYGRRNDMQFGDKSGAYRCHSCGSERNHIEDVRLVQTKEGPEAEMTLSCAHCTTLSIFQITCKDGHIFMGVIAHAMDNRVDEVFDLKAIEWP